ncbi:glycoside hydrolase family 43 protein [Opitutus terrae]|uniref:Alpha-N-arabinofuranosidase n=1 Tax=Opitutus terrae (strain DSM 11246 / JCM 15787 / PB90-1) TaxID=452637 RepID=B1ZQZ8_OPITP|nr:glycoside hydrolase family 43 protein [Opitutus terrae]ACB73665.1 Alpha-N-arabinofuranosidase [Opitutus terrae PB90-1]
MSTKKPLISHLFTADPSAHVFDGKVFIYPSHDLPQDMAENDLGDQYGMTDYHVFSQEHPEGPVTDHGEVLHVKDVPWASRQMWAPDAAFRNGRYYLYFPARDKDGIFRIGVATSTKPQGPFKPEPQPIKGSFSIDPCVFQAADGEFYLAFGGLWGGQLQCWTTGKFVKDAKEPVDSRPALCPKIAKLTPDMLQFATPPQDLVITDASGQPLKGSNTARRYFEGPWMHLYQGTYYLSYSTGDTHNLVYATSKSPLGPFTFRGRFLPPVLGWTTHHSIVEHQGRWWLYYHDASLSGGISYKRSVKVQELFYEADGSIRPMEP